MDFWPLWIKSGRGDYDAEKTRTALARTLNITARDGGQLVGCLRILTDGCFFGTITELLVLPAYQQRGIGSRLLQLAGTHTPHAAVLRHPAGGGGVLQKNGCRRSLPSFTLRPQAPGTP